MHLVVEDINEDGEYVYFFSQTHSCWMVYPAYTVYEDGSRVPNQLNFDWNTGQVRFSSWLERTKEDKNNKNNSGEKKSKKKVVFIGDLHQHPYIWWNTAGEPCFGPKDPVYVGPCKVNATVVGDVWVSYLAHRPVEEPSQQPVEEPSQQPVDEPSQQPVEEPSQQPVEEPSQQPVEEPSQQPVEEPSQQPVEEPSQQPVEEPSRHELKDRLLLSEDQKRKFQEHCQSLKEELEETQKTSKNLRDIIANMTNVANERECSIDHLKAKIENLESQIKDWCEGNVIMTDYLTVTKDELAQTEENNTALENQLVEKEAEITALENQLVEKEAEITALQERPVPIVYEAWNPNAKCFAYPS